MLAVLRTFVDIALTRLGPEDLPASRFLLGLTLAVSVAVHIPLAWIVFNTNEALLTILVVDIGLLVGCLWVLLRLTGYRSRFRQTLTALLGTATLLNLLSLPFALWNASVPEQMPRPAAPSAVILAIVLWSFVIDGHILSRALSKPFAIGLMIAVGYFFLHTTVLFELSPALR